MNPFDMSGPVFIQFYFLCAALAVGLSVALRHLLRSPGPGALPDGPVDPFQLAILHGGPRHAADTALASLVHRRALAVDPPTCRLTLAGPRPSNAHPAENAVHLAFSASPGQSVRADQLRAAVARELRPLVDGLAARGLALPAARAAAVPWLSALPLLLLCGLGSIKVAVGISRGRPIGFLVALVVLSAIAAAFAATRPSHNTRRGTAYLASLRRRNVALRTAAARPSDMLSPTDVITAIALFGFDVVSYGALADLATVLRPPRQAGGGYDTSSSTSACSSSSSCGSSCGGGGCGGCGS